MTREDLGGQLESMRKFKGNGEPLPRALRLARAVTDEYGSRILAATSKAPRTVPEVAFEMAIPIAQAYRRVRELEELGAIEPAGVKANGKRYRRVVMYSCRIQALRFYLGEDGLDVRVQLPDELIMEHLDPADLPPPRWPRVKISGRLTQR